MHNTKMGKSTHIFSLLLQKKKMHDELRYEVKYWNKLLTMSSNLEQNCYYHQANIFLLYIKYWIGHKKLAACNVIKRLQLEY